MAEVFLGSLMCVPYNFAPKGWMFCAGQLLSISQNTALFSLLGTAFGGDGKTTFGLPNLQASVPVGAGQAPGLQFYQMGEKGGVPTVTLITQEMPLHGHPLVGTNLDANSSQAAGSIPAGKADIYKSGSVPMDAQLNPAGFAPSGGSQPHNNLQPYQGLNWIIATQGIYPSRS